MIPLFVYLVFVISLIFTVLQSVLLHMKIYTNWSIYLGWKGWPRSELVPTTKVCYNSLLWMYTLNHISSSNTEVKLFESLQAFRTTRNMVDTKHWYPKQENIFSILFINKN